MSLGKVMYWGTSGVERECRSACRGGKTPPHRAGDGTAAVQHVPPGESGEEFAPLYDTVGLGTTIWSPLAKRCAERKHSLEGDAARACVRLDWTGCASANSRKPAQKKDG